MSNLPEEKDFLEWLNHPVTRAYRDMLAAWEQTLKDQWADGRFCHENEHIDNIANAGALAQLRQLRQLSDLDYDQLREALTPDE